MSTSPTARPSRFLRGAVLSILIVGALAWCFTRGPGRYGIYYVAMRAPRRDIRVWALRRAEMSDDLWALKLRLHCPDSYGNELDTSRRTSALTFALIPAIRDGRTDAVLRLMESSADEDYMVRWRSAFIISWMARHPDVLTRLVAHPSFLPLVEQLALDPEKVVRMWIWPSMNTLLPASDGVAFPIHDMATRATHSSDPGVRLDGYTALLKAEPPPAVNRLLAEMYDDPDDTVFAEAVQRASIAAMDPGHRDRYAWPPLAPEQRLKKLSTDAELSEMVHMYRKAVWAHPDRKRR